MAKAVAGRAPGASGITSGGGEGGGGCGVGMISDLSSGGGGFFFGCRFAMRVRLAVQKTPG